ncbi:MAG TPA: nickel pincer cofactor biosynthesis protein LarC [Clostridia bacterium]|nr:nickel pincer cofactor biosynthesis protein LarC [Clostridia bacterium]
MYIGYFDCFAGISGDMVLGALIDAGLPLDTLKDDLRLLGIDGYEIKAETVLKHGVSGTKVTVVTGEEKAHRHLADIEDIILKSRLPEPVKEKSIAIFRRLAGAEARIHGTTPDKIHFHEVGAVDAIVDIVGAACGLWRLGIEEVYASPVRTGTGLVQCAHGVLPVPAPATLELLQGVPVYGGDIAKELATPTGAAILTAYCRGYGSLPPMEICRVGYGAGGWELAIPNLLRLVIGVKAGQTTARGEDRLLKEPALMLEVNIDDMNPEIYDHLFRLLYEHGAMDVSLVPLQVKKNRPAVMLKVLCAPERLQLMQQVVLRETTSIGLRVYPVEKYMLPYETIPVTGAWGPETVRVKVARLGEEVYNIAPEYEDCRFIAAKYARPLKEIYDLARQAGAEALSK